MLELDGTDNKCNERFHYQLSHDVPCDMKFLQDLIFVNFADFPIICGNKIPLK